VQKACLDCLLAVMLDSSTNQKVWFPFLVFGLCAGLEFCFRLSIDRLFPSHLVRWNPHGISGHLGSCSKQTSNQKVHIVNTPTSELSIHMGESSPLMLFLDVLCIVMLPSMCLL
jgi:hypothetical protein